MSLIIHTIRDDGSVDPVRIYCPLHGAHEATAGMEHSTAGSKLVYRCTGCGGAMIEEVMPPPTSAGAGSGPDGGTNLTDGAGGVA